MSALDEPTNELRAQRVANILPIYKNKMMGEDGEPDESTVADLLADLRHYCNREDLPFDEINTVAEVNYNSEIEEEQ